MKFTKEQHFDMDLTYRVCVHGLYGRLDKDTFDLAFDSYRAYSKGQLDASEALLEAVLNQRPDVTPQIAHVWARLKFNRDSL